MRVLFPGIEDHPVLRELEVTPVSLARLCSKDTGPGCPRLGRWGSAAQKARNEEEKWLVRASLARKSITTTGVFLIRKIMAKGGALALWDGSRARLIVIFKLMTKLTTMLPHSQMDLR